LRNELEIKCIKLLIILEKLFVNQRFIHENISISNLREGLYILKLLDKKGGFGGVEEGYEVLGVRITKTIQKVQSVFCIVITSFFVKSL
jgi:hypothetical protein